MLLIAFFILLFSISVLSIYPLMLFEKIRDDIDGDDIDDRQAIVVQLIIWLVVILISACIRITI